MGIRATQLLLVFVLVALGLAADTRLVASAGAAGPAVVWQGPEDGQAGSEAGRLRSPRGLVTNPANGHVFVAEIGNARVSEFDAWGVFIKAWGWNVAPDGAPGDTPADQLEICTVTCVSGTEGAGAGQLNVPLGVAIDAAGNVYVAEQSNHRVQKFSSSGEFLLMFGGEVNKSTGEDVCTKADLENSEQCGVGIAGADDGEFSSSAVGNYVAVGPDGTVYVGDVERIQEFSPNGLFESDISLPGETVYSLAVDPLSGDIYVAYAQSFEVGVPEKPFIDRLDADTGNVVDELAVGDPDAEPFEIFGFAQTLATDSEGNLYASALQKQTTKQARQAILKFDPDGDCVICPGEDFGVLADNTNISGLATSSGCGVPTDSLFASRASLSQKGYVLAYEPHPDPTICPPPARPPDIKSQFAVSADTTSAVVKSQINPRFWGDTRFYVEYGTASCAGGGCGAEPASPGMLLKSGAVGTPVNTIGVVLTGLQPNTTYHFRFVAESGGGGPVRGTGGVPGVDGAEATFRTFPDPHPLPNPDPCPNSAFRTGPSALLPDCRAYEMVSPVEKENGDIFALRTNTLFLARLVQANPDGTGLTYSSYRAFGDSQSAPWSSQYLAGRDPASGWSSGPINAPREGVAVVGGGENIDLDAPYKAFSSDLCTAWLFQGSEPVLDPAAPVGFAGLYHRDICAGAGYESLNTTAPPFTRKLDFVPELQGFSSDQRCSVFRANDKLTANASSAVDGIKGIYQLYESCKGGPRPRLVSVLPDGTASSVHSSAGTMAGGHANHHEQSGWQAVSMSGSRVYWTAGARRGKLYVRENAPEEQSTLGGGNKCLEPQKACTYVVSNADAQFWAADVEGSKALFSFDPDGGGVAVDDLREYSFAKKSSTLVAHEVHGVLGASRDLSRVYFVSREVLSAGAIAGAPNLYLREGDEFEYIATLSTEDVGINAPLSAVSADPSRRVVRVSPDGLHVVFMSTASLTGFDNIDANSGRSDAEVYLYDADAGGAGELICVSCNPSGARPSGRAFLGANNTVMGVAAKIPPWESQLRASRALSEDGQRVLFESFEALVLRDTNGRQDVYQWERSGRGGCEAGSPTFRAEAGGCVELISSGESPEESEFLEATPDGSSVFFATGSSLLVQDYGLIDIYAARVNGGFPPPDPRRPPCEGEACQSPPAPPDDPTPASSVFNGPGNRKPPCRKGQRRVRRDGKVRCVKRKGGQRHKQAKKGQKARSGR